MITITLALVGLATYYNPGVMQQVADNRGMDLSGYVSGVALNDCAQLGSVVWLRWESGETTGPHLAVDCAAAHDLALREKQGRVVEVDAETARELGFYGVGPAWVSVLFADPGPLPRWREAL